MDGRWCMRFLSWLAAARPAPSDFVRGSVTVPERVAIELSQAQRVPRSC